MRIFNVTVNGVAYEVAVEEVSSTNAAPIAPVVAAPVAAPVVNKPVAAPAAAAPAAAAGEKVNAPMPGTILDVKVSNGAQVKQGDILLILEAMKMENEIVAPCDGKVAQISVSKGQSVNTGDLLIVVA